MVWILTSRIRRPSIRIRCRTVDSLSGGHRSVRRDSFRIGFEPVGAFETTRGVRGSSKSGSFGIVLGCTSTGLFHDLQRVARQLLVAWSSLLEDEYFRGFSISHMWVVLVGAGGHYGLCDVGRNLLLVC
jgi:hypothetical protein